MAAREKVRCHQWTVPLPDRAGMTMCGGSYQCAACSAKGYEALVFDNLAAVLAGLRTATERSPAPVLRGYNRLGRCVLWSP